MVKEAIGRLGHLDLLVNNAGTPATRHGHPTDRAGHGHRRNLACDHRQTNLLSVFCCTRRRRQALKESRRGDGQHGFDRRDGPRWEQPRLRGGESRRDNLTKNLARALAPEVRVNAVAPGSVDSAWMVEWTNEERKQHDRAVASEARCKPEDIAEVIVFLGFGASMVTGQTITVDGGLTL